VIVLWRFYCPGDDLTKQHLELLQRREKRASLAISVTLLLLGVGVTAAAANDLSKGQEEDDVQIGLIRLLSLISIVVFGTLCVVKFHYAHALDSASLYKDGICSTIGCVLAVALLVNSLIVARYPDLWYLDPAVALLCGMVSFWLGLQPLIDARWRQGLPIFTIRWWIVSQGDGMEEMGAQEFQPADFGVEPPFYELTEKHTSANNKDATPDEQRPTFSEMV
jgi:hypothetical protein